jgi:ectoine hydroxylase-related dioxygenase (phytanoyl-CoA dioxygenase family)
MNQNTANLTSNSDLLEKEGVVLIKNCIDKDLIEKVHVQYNSLNSSITRTEIEKEKPIIVFWLHVTGEQKRLTNFEEFPFLWDLINKNIVPLLRKEFPNRTKKLQLLETIIFNKPPIISNTLNWHQDVAYFPLKPNNQIAVWIPFEYVNKKRSAMIYAIGSHKFGIRASINLHTREKFVNDDREEIPDNPSASGFEERVMEMFPTDMLVHDGFTWHYTGPNLDEGFNRKGLSVRFIVEEAVFDPRPGQGAAFTKQIEVNPGDIIRGTAFPDL